MHALRCTATYRVVAALLFHCTFLLGYLRSIFTKKLKFQLLSLLVDIFSPVSCNDAELGSGDVEGCTKHFIGHGGPCDAKLKDQGLCGTSFPQQRGRSKFAERWKQQQTDSQTEKPTDRLTGQPRKTRNEKTFCI